METEIEIAELEVESILLPSQRNPVQACNPKIKIVRECKVKECIRTFRIKRLAIITTPYGQAKTLKKIPKSPNLKMMRLKKEKRRR